MSFSKTINRNHAVPRFESATTKTSIRPKRRNDLDRRPMNGRSSKTGNHDKFGCRLEEHTQVQYRPILGIEKNEKMEALQTNFNI